MVALQEAIGRARRGQAVGSLGDNPSDYAEGPASLTPGAPDRYIGAGGIPTGFGALGQGLPDSPARLKRSSWLGRRKAPALTAPGPRWRDKLPRPSLPDAVSHVLFIGGLLAVMAGCYVIYRPLGPIVGGAIALAIAMLLSEPEPPKKQQPQGR